MRFAFVLLLGLLPNMATAGVHFRVQIRPYYTRWHEYANGYTSQNWRIVPRGQLMTLPSAENPDSVAYNRLGQRWRTEPIPDEPSVEMSPTTDDQPGGYQHPDPNFGPEVFLNPNYTVRRVYRNIEVTSYNSERRQTDSTPWEIRTNYLVRFGDAACNFLPKGTLFRLPNAPAPFNRVIFRVEDETAAKYGHRIDLWLLHVRQAENWGVKRLTVEVLGPPRGEAPR